MGPGFRPRATHFVLAAQALDEILEARRPADAIVGGLLRQRRSGAKDRAVVSSLVYGVLRNFFPLRARLGEDAGSIELCAALALQRGEPVPQLREVDAREIEARLSRDVAIPESALHNLPAWIWDRLCGQFAGEAADLARALNEEARVDLRVNLLRGTRAQALERLAAEGLAAAALPEVPTAIRLGQRTPLQKLQCFQDGWIEPQDAGSQRLVLALDPRPGEAVADFCAGTGGKTLAIGALMQDRGRLLAVDSSRARLARLAPRVERSGLTQVQVLAMATDEPPAAELLDAFDAVLVDAPCSGIGTLRRHPELRLQPDRLGEFQARQNAILWKAAMLVRPGGRLMYSTCSLFREENEDVVEGFLAGATGFAPLETLRLLPHRDGCDGYYAVTLRRGR